LMGCQTTLDNRENSLSAEQFDSLQIIREYLSTEIASVGFGGQPYCAYETLEAEQIGEEVHVYLWVVCQEYYSQKQELLEGTGASLPVALILEEKMNTFTIVSHRVPRDGSLYTQDLSAIFPENFRKKLQSERTTEQNKRVRKLQNQIEQNVGR
ncbi:MAG: hypothetical protein WBB82_18100, partial [Limnothrix sp.]